MNNLQSCIPIDEEHFLEVIDIAVASMKREPAIKLFDLQDHDEFLVADMKSAICRSMRDKLGFMVLERGRVISCFLAVDSRKGPIVAEGCKADVRIDRWSRLNEDAFEYAPKGEIYVYGVFIASLKEHEGKGIQSMLFKTMITEAWKQGFKYFLMDITSAGTTEAVLRRGGIIFRRTYKFSEFEFNGERPYVTSDLTMDILYCDLERILMSPKL